MAAIVLTLLPFVVTFSAAALTPPDSAKNFIGSLCRAC